MTCMTYMPYGFDVRIIVFLIIALAVVVLIVTVTQGRRHSGRADEKVCGNCGTSHPPFAQFCRRCGRKLG